jgi:hypothetical protein
LASQLQAKGYEILTTHNADRTDYAKTIVYYSSGNEEKAKYLARSFPGIALEPLPPQVAAAIPAPAKANTGEAVVVVGADLPTGLPSSAPTTAPVQPAGPPVNVPSSVPWFSAC